MELNPTILHKGNNVTISPFARIYCDYLEIGDNVRIDDFCILTGNIKIGSNIHIGCFDFLCGGNGIELEDFVQLSSRVSLYSANDDYSGHSLVGPCISDEFKPGLQKGKILLKKHTLIGTNSVVMPGITTGEGCAIGAFSFVNNDIPEWEIWGGRPIKYLAKRSKNMLNFIPSVNKREVRYESGV